LANPRYLPYVENRATASRDELLAIIDALTAQVSVLSARVAELETELARLRGKSSTPPTWVKPNRPAAERKPRRHRKQAFVRRREQPTEIREHALETCPDCGRKLTGGSVHRSRQVIEIIPAQVQIVEHQFIGRRCGVCGRRVLPQLSDAELGAVGKHRFGVNIQSLAALLHISYRLPISMIRRFFREVHGLQISAGEIVALAAGVAAAGTDEVEAIRTAVLASPAVCSDETGWREAGQNGFLWGFATPAHRYFRYRHSRARAVAEGVFGEAFAGTIVSDFYSAYNQLPGGHQRCWAHLLRDLHQLKADHAQEPGVTEWVEAIHTIYQQATSFADPRQKARRQSQVQFERELAHLARPYRKQADAPQRVLAERIHRFRGELFTFVADPRVPTTNNLAERSLRPPVIARKISGGTRSETGSQTRTSLMSLFGTWAAQNPPEAGSPPAKPSSFAPPPPDHKSLSSFVNCYARLLGQAPSITPLDYLLPSW